MKLNTYRSPDTTVMLLIENSEVHTLFINPKKVLPKSSDPKMSTRKFQISNPQFKKSQVTNFKLRKGLRTFPSLINLNHPPPPPPAGNILFVGSWGPQLRSYQLRAMIELLLNFVQNPFSHRAEQTSILGALVRKSFYKTVVCCNLI